MVWGETRQVLSVEERTPNRMREDPEEEGGDNVASPGVEDK